MSKKVLVTASLSIEYAQWVEDRAYRDRRSQSSILAEYIEKGILSDMEKEKSQ